MLNRHILLHRVNGLAAAALLMLCTVMLSTVSWAQQDSAPFTPSAVRPNTQEPPPTDQVESARVLPPIDFNALRGQSLPTAEQNPTLPQSNEASTQIMESPIPDDGQVSGLPVDIEAAAPRHWPDPGAPNLDDAAGTVTRQLNSASADDRKKLSGEWIAHFGLGRATQPLPGQPISLADALRETAEPMRRDMVQQYWQSFACWAKWLAANDSLIRLQSGLRPQSVADQNLWQSALNRAQVRVSRTALDLMREQTKLQRFLPVTGQSELLPLPSDLPLVRGYTTQFDWYQGQLGSNRNELRLLDRTIPLLHELIGTSAQATQSCQQTWQQTTQAYANGQASLVSVLYADQAWLDACEDFVMTVSEYNQTIAQYSLNLVGSGNGAEQLTAMLIGTPALATAPGDSADFPVRQANLGLDAEANTFGDADSRVAPVGFAPRFEQPVGTPNLNPQSGAQPQTQNVLPDDKSNAFPANPPTRSVLESEPTFRGPTPRRLN